MICGFEMGIVREGLRYGLQLYGRVAKAQDCKRAPSMTHCHARVWTLARSLPECGGVAL